MPGVLRHRVGSRHGGAIRLSLRAHNLAVNFRRKVRGWPGEMLLLASATEARGWRLTTSPLRHVGHGVVMFAVGPLGNWMAAGAVVCTMMRRRRPAMVAWGSRRS